jgi:hypothetical protein
MGMVHFYWRTLRRAFRGWAGLARALVFFASLAIVLEHKFLSSSMQFSISTDTILLWCAGVAIIWGVLRAPYLVFDEEKQRADSAERKIKGSLKFARAIRREGGGGHYSSYVTVTNTSVAEKMHNCRCEVAELFNSAGDVIHRNIGLTIRGQQGERFALDQNSNKEVPIFEIDQSESGFCVYLLGAAEKIRLDYDNYTARVCGYGDAGRSDEITVQLDIRSSEFFKLIA